MVEAQVAGLMKMPVGFVNMCIVVVWEPKRGTGGGHQSAQDKAAAEALRWRMSRERPDDEIR